MPELAGRNRGEFRRRPGRRRWSHLAGHPEKPSVFNGLPAHLSAAAAALDPMSGLTSAPATGTHVSIDAMGRSRVQAAASQADRTRLVHDARRVAETSAPGVRGMLVYQVCGPSVTR